MERKVSREQFLYKKIYRDIKEKIEKGELPEGATLPHGAELAKLYEVSSITVTKALDALKEEGYVQRVKGKGSFVRIPDSFVPEEAARQDEAEAQTEKQEEIRSGQPKMIGLILEHVSSCFGLDLLYRIDFLARQAGYQTCIRFSYGDRERETEEIRFLKALGVEGMILMPCHGRYYNVTILEMVVEGFPMVLIDKHMEGIPVPSVRTDNHQAMKALVEHLVKQGKQRIGFITMLEDGTSSIKDRQKGFRDAVKEAGVAKMPECYLKSEEQMDIFSESINERHVSQMTSFLKKNKQLDAVICAEYGIARCINHAKEAAKADKLTVCCIDEDYHSPDGFHFTHIRQDEEKMAKKAFEILLEKMEKQQEEERGDYLIPGIFREK